MFGRHVWHKNLAYEDFCVAIGWEDTTEEEDDEGDEGVEDEREREERGRGERWPRYLS
jgi:hypothetical protein